MPKTPNPVTKDSNMASYFERTPEAGVRCVAAALSLDSATHVVICAPDIIILKRAWKELSGIPIDIKKCPITLYKYDAEKKIEDVVSPVIAERAQRVSKLMSAPNSNIPWFWFYRRKGNMCFIESNTEKESDIKLGPAVVLDVAECKRLLRENKIARTYLETMKIDTNTDDLIPF